MGFSGVLAGIGLPLFQRFDAVHMWKLIEYDNVDFSA